MKERPIIFSGPMVRALLDGTKTQTRRPIKPQPNDDGLATDTLPMEYGIGWRGSESSDVWRCPYGQSGDRLWVRERWTVNLSGDPKHGGPGTVPIYHADTPNATDRWRPSIHMPRWASRLTLEVTDVRVQRVQEITEQDALAEGVANTAAAARLRFADRWDSLYYERAGLAFDANPWVWAITFRRVA